MKTDHVLQRLQRDNIKRLIGMTDRTTADIRDMIFQDGAPVGEIELGQLQHLQDRIGDILRKAQE